MTNAEYKRQWYLANRDRILQERSAYRRANADKIKAHRDGIPASKKAEYRSRVDKDEQRKRMRDWRNRNNKRIKEYSRTYAKNKSSSDVNYRLATVLRKRIEKAVNSNAKSGSAVRDLGCSVEAFKVHIERQFQPGMTWENWGHRGWHIDHIRPLSSFNLVDRNEFLIACHYTNMQPLWAVDNLRKGAKC